MEDKFSKDCFPIKLHFAIGRYLKIGDLMQWFKKLSRLVKEIHRARRGYSESYLIKTCLRKLGHTLSF